MKTTDCLPIAVEVVCGLALICGYLWYRRGSALPWANRTVLAFALVLLAYGLFGLLSHWDHLGINAAWLGFLTRTRPVVGGIAIGLVVALILSGEFWRIGRRDTSTQDTQGQ